MKITKSTLKQIIKEEIEAIQEVDIPFSAPGHRPGIPSMTKPTTAGPEAVGDIASQALHNTQFFLEGLLSDPEIGSLSGGYYKHEATKLLAKVSHAKEAFQNAQIANLDK